MKSLTKKVVFISCQMVLDRGNICFFVNLACKPECIQSFKTLELISRDFIDAPILELDQPFLSTFFLFCSKSHLQTLFSWQILVKKSYIHLMGDYNIENLKRIRCHHRNCKTHPKGKKISIYFSITKELVRFFT